MKHTECKDCELSNGDCGNHFKMDGITNYEIASLSACDKYGNCMFFKAKAKPQGDLISREALKKAVYAEFGNSNLTDAFNDIIDNAPTVEIPTELCKGCRFLKDCETCEEKLRPQGEWIPVSERLPEKEGYYLVALGNGQMVVAHSDAIIANHDFEPKMLAWQPLPEPYKEGDAI